MQNTNHVNTDAPPQNQIETLIVSVDEIVEALRFNRRPEGYKNRRDAVLRVKPQFEQTSEASLFYRERGTRYDRKPYPFHIDPVVFVEDRDQAEPRTRNEYHAQANEHMDDPSGEEISESVEMAYEWWEDYVRSNLLSEVDINNSDFERSPPNIVTVQYKDG
ncbi:hypothetical protein [Salinarchaeum laminariae]|uniref:hypothetical protein n=1 Tax=Salinarchaeum laminariae TaxID=869888 RepID=UPI0020BEB7B2|nr:hypothetical protein [Salinarchaeum laminariae]